MELTVAEKLAIVRDSMVEDSTTERDKVLRELENWGGRYSPYGYSMKRAAEMFFPVWDKDWSFFMLDKCCELLALNGKQKRIIRECLEKHGFKE